MIDVVFPETRMAYAAAILQMHHDRKRVFVDALGWTLPCPGSWLEVDDFDNDHAVYLLARSLQTGGHNGSVRLLPTTRRHMLSALFSELCAGDVPTGDDCWEISRLVATPPSIAGTSIIKMHRVLALALVEFALLNSIRRYTLVAEPHRVPALLSVGWPVVPLGLPADCMGQQLQALQISIPEGTLDEMRSKFHVAASVLRFERADRLAA
jgi:N-acyl-L-homoserine lactone synthetase